MMYTVYKEYNRQNMNEINDGDKCACVISILFVYLTLILY